MGTAAVAALSCVPQHATRDLNTESGVSTWTSVFTVSGKTSVICRENDKSVALLDANKTTTPLGCQEQPPPSSFQSATTRSGRLSKPCPLSSTQAFVASGKRCQRA